MKDLNEFYTFLKGKSDAEMANLIDKDVKELVKKYGSDADLYFKSQIRLLDNLKNLTEWYFRDKLPNLIRQQSERKEKDKLLTVGDVAKELGFTEPTIYSWIKTGVIEARSIGMDGKRNSYRIERAEVERVKKGLKK